MHSILFQIKRAFHASVFRLGLPLLRHFGLTPARFDLLFALRDHLPPDQRERMPWDTRSLYQSQLRKLLGVSRTTVSRLLQTLQRLGLIRRSSCTVDSRQRNVSLTPLGAHRLDRVLAELISEGYVDLQLDHILVPEEAHTPVACIIEKEAFELRLLRFRTALGDRAALAYPWHPDD